MKFDYCIMHSGSVVGGQDLSCLAIRHDDGRAARPAEVWAEITRLRVALIDACEIVQRERARLAYNREQHAEASVIHEGYGRMLAEIVTVLRQADAALGVEREQERSDG